MSRAPKNILFFAPFANWPVHAQVEAIVAKALALRGGKVTVLRCNDFYRNCVIARGHPQDCPGCVRTGDILFGPALGGVGVEQMLFNRFIQDADRDMAEHWGRSVSPDEYPTAHFQSLEIGAWALPSVLTHFRILPESLSLPHIWTTAQDFLIHTLLTHIAMSRAMEVLKPDVVFLFNGRFYPFRAAFEAVRQHGVTAVVHERGFVGDSFMFYENKTILGTSQLADVYEAWRHVPLDAGELVRGEDALEGRRSGKSLNYPLFYDSTEQASRDIYQWLNIPHGAKVFGVFTSSQDEYSSYEGYGDAANQVEFLDNLFEVFRDRSEYVVVRHHPHIGGGRTNIPEVDMMRHYHAQALRAPRNVRIIQPSEKLTSYEIFPCLDYAIAPFSTISLETTAAGIPTASYHTMPHAGVFTHKLTGTDPASIRQLVEDMVNAGTDPVANDLRQTYRFYHGVYMTFSLEFRTMGIKDGFSPDLRVRSVDDLKPGADPCLDHICDFVFRNGPLYVYPQPEQRARSDADERSFFARKLAAIDKFRAERAARIKPLVADPPVLAVRVRDRRIGPCAPVVEGWQERLRYSALQAAELSGMAQAPSRAVIARILEKAAEVAADYVLIYPEGIQFDESAVCSAIEAMRNAGGQGGAAVFFSGWIMIKGARHLQRLHAHDKTLAQWEEFHRAMPLFRDPLCLLGLSIWRRSALADLMAMLPEDADEAAVRRLLLEMLAAGPGVLRLEEPMYMLHLD